VPHDLMRNDGKKARKAEVFSTSLKIEEFIGNEITINHHHKIKINHEHRCCT
jgi:hypothetical protein